MFGGLAHLAFSHDHRSNLASRMVWSRASVSSSYKHLSS